ncbi:MAG: hypothetical protein ACU83O_09060, partial [Gammaproteobacteria bacterium]
KAVTVKVKISSYDEFIACFGIPDKIGDYVFCNDGILLGCKVDFSGGDGFFNIDCGGKTNPRSTS